MDFILKYFIFGSYDAAETTKPFGERELMHRMDGVHEWMEKCVQEFCFCHFFFLFYFLSYGKHLGNERYFHLKC